METEKIVNIIYYGLIVPAALFIIVYSIYLIGSGIGA